MTYFVVRWQVLSFKEKYCSFILCCNKNSFCKRTWSPFLFFNTNRKICYLKVKTSCCSADIGILKLETFLSNDGFNNSNKASNFCISFPDEKLSWSDNNERILQENVWDLGTFGKTLPFWYTSGFKGWTHISLGTDSHCIMCRSNKASKICRFLLKIRICGILFTISGLQTIFTNSKTCKQYSWSHRKPIATSHSQKWVCNPFRFTSLWRCNRDHKHDHLIWIVQ